MELDKIYHEDCLVGMKRIPDGSVDMILTDLPYQQLSRQNKDAQWDVLIPFEPLWEQWLRVAKPNAAIVLFCQGMFTCQLIIDDAEREGRVVVASTNLTIAEIEKKYGKRTLDRLRALANCVSFTGESMRR